MRKLGRPQKANPVKAGELKSNLCRFTFIAEKEKILAVKLLAERKGISVKELMDEVLTMAINLYDASIKTKSGTKKPVQNKLRMVSKQNEERLKNYLNKRE